MNKEEILRLVKQNFGVGCYHICKERLKQIEKHGFTGEHHANHPEWYENGQLQQAAHGMLAHELYEQAEVYDQTPQGWDEKWWEDLCNRSNEERLIISGSFSAAEIDRRVYK